MSAIKFSTGMDHKAIVLAIASIKTRGAKLDNDIQLTGLSILAHIQKHREVSLFGQLYDAMPKGSRKNALLKWAVAFGCITVNMDKDTCKAQPFLFNKERADSEKGTDLQGATDKPWFLFKPEATPRDEFSFDEALAKLQELVAKKIKAGVVDKTDRRIQILMGLSPEFTPEKIVTEDYTDADAKAANDAEQLALKLAVVA